MKFTKETARRAVRTFLQSAIGFIATELVAVDFTDTSTLKAVLVGLCASAIATGISAIMNLEHPNENDDQS